ncbi:lysosomal protective protein-like [Leptodactylus fuscus]
MLPLLLCALYLGVRPAEAAPEADEIIALPGINYQPSFRQFSGFLNASGGKHLHYWFVQCQGDPRSCPLVLWLNGGPGCSSLAGLLTEHGPFLSQPDGSTLKTNKYSWNKIANVLYLESPAGVGFSYSDDKEYTTGDAQTAKDNYMALKDFFHLYPEFKENDFYITGESYGGFYVPSLALEVAKDSGINLKGLAIGNGVTDMSVRENSLIYFSYYHGLLDVRDYGDYIKAYHPGIMSTESHSQFSKKLKEMSRLNKTISMSVPCVNDTDVTTYLNNPEVRSALHIPNDLPPWEICNGNVFSHFKREMENARDQYLQLLSEKKYRILVYTGDTDMACDFLGIEWFVHSLKLKEEKSYHPWMYKDGKQSQIAGYAKQYANLTLLTVKGAGHMVPTDKPLVAFQMFRRFINNKPF